MANGKVMIRLLTGIVWLGGRGGVSVKYVRDCYVETGVNGLQIPFKSAFISSGHSQSEFYMYIAGAIQCTNSWLSPVYIMHRTFKRNADARS